MTKSVFIATRLLKNIVTEKIKHLGFVNLIIIIIFFYGLTYYFKNIYPYIVDLSKSLNINLVLLLLGTILGIFVGLSQFDKDEFHFLYLTTYSKNVISWYYILKLTASIFCVSLILFGSSLFYDPRLPNYLLEIMIIIILGSLLGIYTLLFFYSNVKYKLIEVICVLIIFAISWFNGYLGIKLITFLFLAILLFRCVRSSWAKRLYGISRFEQKKKTRLMSNLPVIKKELILLSGAQRIIPLMIFLVVGQFLFTLEQTLSFNVTLTVTLFLIGLMHSGWSLDSIGLEGSTIYLYKYTGLSLKKLIITKWSICFISTTTLSMLIYLFWSIHYNFSLAKMSQNILILIAFSLLINIIYFLISMKFSDFNRRSSSRVNIYGGFIAVLALLLVFGMIIISWKIIIILSTVLGIIFVILLRRDENIRRFINVP